MLPPLPSSTFIFLYDTATTEIFTLPLHDALPISPMPQREDGNVAEAPISRNAPCPCGSGKKYKHCHGRSEEHTSELQSRQYLVCRLLLEKKKNLTRDDAVDIVVGPDLKLS